jgi:hypothetical protein
VVVKRKPEKGERESDRETAREEGWGGRERERDRDTERQRDRETRV